MKDALCKAFCEDLAVRDVPAGLAVKTTFRREDGDAIGFYIVGPDQGGLYRIEDDGNTIPNTECAGADLDSPTRSAAFRSLLEEYGVLCDEESGELLSEPLRAAELPQAAMRFVALLLRLQDLLLLTPERVSSTFREDALKAIRDTMSDVAEVSEDEPVHPSLSEYPADVVIRAKMRPPVAVFFGSTEQKIYEAILLRMASVYETQTPCTVVALLEKGTIISQKMRQRADNRLDAVPVFAGDERAAVDRIKRAVFSAEPTVH